MELRDELFGVPGLLVMDPVHGGIPFFAHEEAVIDHPLFQRLRWIVQNDITSLVFPGAVHSRFQHSIGAMHVAGRLLKSVVRGYLSDRNRKRLVPLTDDQENAIKYFYFCIRLAALLHDAGHFPFSHQIEGSKEFQNLLQRDSAFDDLWRGVPSASKPKKQRKLSHESYSLRCAHEILGDVGRGSFPVHIIDVLALMEGSSAKPSPLFVECAWDALNLLIQDEKGISLVKKEEVATTFQGFFQTIISGELDVDKMDYLLRDSFFSGCRYGMYNLDHLLSTIRIGFNPPGAKPWVGLAVTDKGVAPLEDFVYSRFQLYQELYSHKTVVGFKWLLGRALDELLQYDKDARQVTERALTDLGAFSNFTDTYFWEKLRLFAARVPGSAAQHLISRRPLEHVMSQDDLADFEKERLIGELKRHRGGRTIIVHSSPIKFSKMAQPYEKIRVLHSDPFQKRRSLRSIQKHSSFFQKFHDIVITHFYEEPELRKPSEPAANRLRKKSSAVAARALGGRTSARRRAGSRPN